MNKVEREFMIKARRNAAPLWFLCLSLISCLAAMSPDNLNAQWRKLWDFDDVVGVVYFLEDAGYPNIGFVGLDDLEVPFGFPPTGGTVWKTTDGGVSWRVVDTLKQIQVTAIIFKDSLVGWATASYDDRPTDGGGIYKTTDGGESWFSIFYDSQSLCKAVFYNSTIKRLFVSRWGGDLLYSDDEGSSWLSLPFSNLNGFSFVNPLQGIISTVDAPSTTPRYLRTSDGGFTWNYIPNMGHEAWQPLSIKNTPSYLVFPEIIGGIWRSDDLGENWSQISSLPTAGYKSGHIGGDASQLYVQQFGGFYQSLDGGIAWKSICGPWNTEDTRFFINSSNTIYAADYRHMNNTLGSGLWINPTGEANSPRLKLFTNSNNTQTIVPGNKTFVDVLYPGAQYHEAVDSVCFHMRIAGAELIGFDYDSLASGWTVKSRKVTDSTIHYCIENSNSASVNPNSFVLRINLNSFVGRDTSATITLHEVTFNNDVNFTDCMIASISATDTVQFVMADDCTSSYLREFMLGRKIIEILRVYPNPTTDDISIDFYSALEQDAMILILDNVGKVLLEQSVQARQGINSQLISLPSGWLGNFYIKLRLGRDEVVTTFIKQ